MFFSPTGCLTLYWTFDLRIPDSSRLPTQVPTTAVLARPSPKSEVVAFEAFPGLRRSEPGSPTAISKGVSRRRPNGRPTGAIWVSRESHSIPAPFGSASAPVSLDEGASRITSSSTLLLQSREGIPLFISTPVLQHPVEVTGRIVAHLWASSDAPDSGSMAKVSYDAYGTLKYWVHPAAGDIDADSYAEFVTAPGPGSMFAPQVRGWNYDDVAIAAMPSINGNVFPSPEYGCHVGLGDVNGDGSADGLFGPGPGPSLGQRLRGFELGGGPMSPLAGLDRLVFPGLAYGLKVSAGDIEGTPSQNRLPVRAPTPVRPAACEASTTRSRC